MKLISLLKKITVIITIHITNKVAYRVYRARRDELVALVVTDVSRSSRRAVSRLLYSMHDTARTTFRYQNAWAR